MWAACAEAGGAEFGRAGSRSDWLVDDGSDPANDHVPVFVEFYGNHGLDIQDVLRAVPRFKAWVDVVLQGNADEAGYGVLRGFSQRFGLCCVLCCRGACGRSTLLGGGDGSGEGERGKEC